MLTGPATWCDGIRRLLDDVLHQLSETVAFGHVPSRVDDDVMAGHRCSHFGRFVDVSNNYAQALLRSASNNA